MNVLAKRSRNRAGLLERWHVMQACVERGYRQEGILPGGLKVRRRAPELFRQLSTRDEAALASRGAIRDPLAVIDWVDLFALAVSEENAAGGRVVTAPTNGAAGIIPAVLHYYWRFVPDANDDGIVRFCLRPARSAFSTSSTRHSRAPKSVARVKSASPVRWRPVRSRKCSAAPCRRSRWRPRSAWSTTSASRAIPIGGLVQVPCIERCAMAAVKAINASRMALRSDGQHRVSLDRVIRTMRETGRDMLTKYKETSRGGLAVAVTSAEVQYLLRLSRR